MFLARLADSSMLTSVARVQALLYGSLGATGKGHGSDTAVMLGLAGHEPETVDPDEVPAILAEISTRQQIKLNSQHPIVFTPHNDIVFLRKEVLPLHANGMRFVAYGMDGREMLSGTYYSVGGGFVITDEVADDGAVVRAIRQDPVLLPLAFKSGSELLARAVQHEISIAQVMRINERHWRTDEQIDSGLLRIWNVMQDCVARGCHTEGTLPGGFRVKRRAAAWYQKLAKKPHGDPLDVMDWVNLYALAVNEENAAGGRVVTAPTNGAAGIIPSVLHYYCRFTAGANDAGVIDFLLTAAAIGILYKENASISGAEVGCQGEVGVACSMAAGALCAVLGGTPQQVENAAEIGMEHHLGLTCDPVGGLVQIPCIERNAIASVKAINAARMALQGNGDHHVSLDKVIKTMRETGADMLTKYKETARGGLAVNIIEC